MSLIIVNNTELFFTPVKFSLLFLQTQRNEPPQSNSSIICSGALTINLFEFNITSIEMGKI